MSRSSPGQERTRTARLDRRDVPSLEARSRMSDSINATMNADQGASPRPPPQLALGNPGVKQLGTRYDSVRSSPELSEYPLDCPVLETHSVP